VRKKIIFFAGQDSADLSQKSQGKGLSFYFSLLTFSFLAFPASVLAEGGSLGVVRSGDNATQWMGITTRLSQSGISYCVVDLPNVEKAGDLTGATVLFLPNIESLTAQQAIALSEFIKKGGRLIVSGPAGNLSTPEVRQMLRGILGAYWAFPLSEPSTLKPKTASQSKDAAARTLSGTVHGGVIVPTSINSQTAATWSLNDNPPAVVTTNRTTFLGWRWGVDSVASIQTDLAWLQSALSRYGVKTGTASFINQTPGNCFPPNTVPVAAASRVQPRPQSLPVDKEGRRGRVQGSRREIPNSQSSVLTPQWRDANSQSSVLTPEWRDANSPSSVLIPQSRVSNTQSRVPNPQARVPNPQARVPNPQSRVSDTQSRVSDTQSRVSNTQARVSDTQLPVLNLQSPIPSTRYPIPSTQSLVLNLQSPIPSTQVLTRDPAERVATAGIRVTPGAEVITPQEAYAMRLELENLINRVESALLTADAANSSVRIASGNLSNFQSSFSATVAATSPVSTQQSAANTLLQAREVLRNMPDLINRRDYPTARIEWVKARQSLWNLYPIDRTVETSEIRAIWLDRGSIIQAGSEQGLAKVFDRLAQAGINTVFFETVNAGYPIYPSKVAPESNPQIKGWDPLASAVKLAHERGMELHAWVWTFAIGNQRHNTILNQPESYLGPVLTAHPDWANYDNRGNIIPVGQTKPFLDPANPEVRSYLLKLFEEIVSRYKVDGLQLDYIRYPFQDPNRGYVYGYGGAARQQFQQLTGVDPITISPGNNALWQRWTEFRTNQVNSFVAEVSQMLRQKRSNLLLSVAVFAYPEAERIQRLQQNWEVWARRGDVDFVSPMAYAQDTNSFQQLAQPWLVNESLGGVLVLPGILLLNLPEMGAIDQIQFVRDFPNGGYSLFALEHLSNSLQNIFSRTQPTVRRDAKEPIPLRQPFAAAANRYAVLQREWNFLLAKNELVLAPAERALYNSQSVALANSLNRLAKEANGSNFEAAKRDLSLFRSQFSGWMRLHSMRNSYQVQIWNNRLASLERLLNYGERVVLKRSNSAASQR